MKPIYDLTRKGRQFLWEKEQQQAFDEIKCRLQRPPVLHLPDRHGRFQLYSDTSKFATGSALYQIQNGQPKLIAYASKRMPEAAKNYSITELEMCGLAMNIATFSHLLKKVDFDAIVDHLAITHIMRSKAEPATTRIKRLLELLSPYSFNLYYIKGKVMVLSDFLSRQKMDDSNPHELIPISFMLRSQIDNYFYQIDNEHNQPKNDRYLVQTRSQVKSSGIKLPEIHGTNKSLDSHVQPGKQRPFPSLPIQTINKGLPTHPIPRPKIGQGRAGHKRKVKALQPISAFDLCTQDHVIDLLVIYRYPNTRVVSFCNDLADILGNNILTLKGHCILTGDFNIHIDDTSDNNTRTLNDMLDSLGMINHITFPTHKQGHTLDLFIEEGNSMLITKVTRGHLISDHHFIHAHLNICKNKPKVNEVILKS